MQIKINSELLADLKDKAEKATKGMWYDYYEPKDNMIEGPLAEWIMGLSFKGDCPFFDNPLVKNDNLADELAELCPAEVDISRENLSYIAAANPAVILALIEKIEELQTCIQYLNDWAEYDKEESFKHIDFVNELKIALEIDDDIPDKKACPMILQKIKELIGNGKSSD